MAPRWLCPAAALVASSGAVRVRRQAAGLSLQAALLEDAFPESGEGCQAPAGASGFTYDFAGSSGPWAEMNKGFEKDAFLAEFSHAEANSNHSWRLRVGQGGNVYSLRGAYGEAMPPQHHAKAPFIDEVLQQVAVSLPKNKPGDGEAYFIHQAGTYQKEADLVSEPFFSPSLAKHCAGGICSFVSWGQHATVPTKHQSGLLYYTRYRDCGSGVLEVTWMMHNAAPTAGFSGDTLDYLNVPWGGVRASTLKSVVVATKDGLGAKLQEPLKAFSDNSYIPNLRDFGGYTTFAQDLPKQSPFQLPVVSGQPLKLVLAAPCAESPGHTEGWHKYTLHCRLRQTVNPGDQGWRGEALEFSGGSQNGGKMRVSAGVMHWAYGGRHLFLWPEGHASDFNSRFKPGDEIKVSYAASGFSTEDNLALTFVHGTDKESPGRRPARMRFGSTNPTRDYTVWTVNVQPTVQPGHSYWSRQYLVSGRYEESHRDASPWVQKAAQAVEAPSGLAAGRNVTLYSVDGSTFRAAVAGGRCEGAARCSGRTSPSSGLPPLFSVACGSAARVTSDPYALSPQGPPFRPYRCAGGGRPTWKLLGYFTQGDCSTIKDASYDESICL